MTQAQQDSETRPVRYFDILSKNGPEVRLGLKQVKKVDFIWRLFNALPGQLPRLQRAQDATARIENRKKTTLAPPPREGFASTAAYYEAIVPVAVASQRFISQLEPEVNFASLRRAVASVMPRQLF